jgi:SAM-dependent methyltransferase
MHILRSSLVRPLEAPFGALLDDLARSRGWPTSSDAARMGALVRKLSDAYNGPDAAPLRTNDALAARLVFSFPRDVPKGGGAVRELVATGALALPSGRPLRVLDVGAGLGATSRGVMRALHAHGATGEVVVDAVDADRGALDLAAAIARARPSEGDVKLELRVHRTDAGGKPPVRGPYDLILLGQVLSELDRDADDTRVDRHAALLRTYADELRDDGSLVVIEPALRERTRHLHAVRDALLARAGTKLNVFAPCVHDAPCPVLMSGEAWCHEDLDVDLPPWLVPVARAAGLRWQGLTFSYLVLRKDGRRQTGAAPLPPGVLRVVSGPVVTKGKRELFLCGSFEGLPDAARLKVMRIDRHASEANEAWDEAARGDLLELVPAPTSARPRVEIETQVKRVTQSD